MSLVCKPYFRSQRQLWMGFLARQGSRDSGSKSPRFLYLRIGIFFIGWDIPSHSYAQPPRFATYQLIHLLCHIAAQVGLLEASRRSFGEINLSTNLRTTYLISSKRSLHILKFSYISIIRCRIKNNEFKIDSHKMMAYLVVLSVKS